MIPIVSQRLLRYLVAPVTIALFSYVLYLHAAPAISEKTITVVNQELQDPVWKKKWDEARILAQQEDYDSAIEKYLEVLQEKPHIEEVKWELSRNYIVVEEYEKALLLLEGLLETAPDKIDYLVSAGQTALALGKTDQALKFYGKVLALDPEGVHSETALLGMIESLKVQGKVPLAIPLMEQLYGRGVQRPELLIDLARHYSETANLEKGAYYYRQLLSSYTVEPEIRTEAAAVFEKVGNFEEAARQWEIYLESNPEKIEPRVKLVEYYLERDDDETALDHLQVLLDKNVNRQKYLLQAARINLYGLGRSDKALSYFEQYREEFPDGVDVSKEISNLHLILANDLLAIVENDGVLKLWQDLARVTPDRIGIYRAMAEMLEEMGRKRESDLIEVLQIINAHEPDDFEIIAKIAKLHIKNRMYSDCLSFLAQVDKKQQSGEAYLLLKAQCLDGAGLDFDLLQNYAAYLQKKPKDAKARTEAITLASKLGLVKQMQTLYQQRQPADNASVDEAYIHGLIANGLTDEAYRSYLSKHELADDTGSEMRIRRDLAFQYVRQNRLFKAEQLLRSFAADHPESAYSYLLLAHYFIVRQDSAKAAVWLSALEKKNGSSELSLSPEQRSVLFYEKLLLDQLYSKVGIYQKSVAYLNDRIKADQIVAEDVDILIFAARHYLLTNRYDECIKLIKRYQQKFKGVDRLDSLMFVARQNKAGRRPLAIKKIFKKLPLSLAFSLSDQLLDLGRYDEAKRLLAEIAASLPESTRTTLKLAAANFATSDYETSYENYTILSQNFAEESYFREQLLRIENLQGKPDSIFNIYSVATDDSGRKSYIACSYDSMDYPEAKLMWARALWSEDRWEEALDVYGLLDTELQREIDQLIEIIQDRPESAVRIPGFSADYFSARKHENELIDLVMGTTFLADHLAHQINTVSSDYYDYYRWAKIVEKEMTAKSSLKAREFYQAEIDYQQLIEEESEVATEIYPDLATIYGRLGRFQEESEVLETIKEKSIFYPDLAQMSEMNIRRRQPFLSFDFQYLEEEGRDGYKDITQKYAGLGLQIKPTIYQEAGMVAGRNEYGDSLASTLAKSNYILGTYAIQFNDFFDGEFKFGFEDFDTDGKSFLHYDFALKGYLEQRVELLAAVKQRPVYDTIESLEQGIYKQDFQLGFNLDYLFGLFFGFDLSLSNYNDDNEGDRYYLWSSYRWFGDRSSLDFTYSYLNIQNKITNESFTDVSPDSLEEGPSYWSPGDYWKHGLTALYKLELWPTGRLQSGTSSFSAMYGVGYEQGDVLVQEFETNILLEISPSFLVKGSFSTVISDDYDNLKGYFSVVYRW